MYQSVGNRPSCVNSTVNRCVVSTD